MWRTVREHVERLGRRHRTEDAPVQVAHLDDNAPIRIPLEVHLTPVVPQLFRPPRSTIDGAQHVRRRRCGDVGNLRREAEGGSTDSSAHWSC